MIDITSAYGLEFLFPARDKIVGASLRNAGEFARPEMEIMARLLAANPGTYIDVGGNIGSMALPIAALNPTSRVIAIEANRHLAGILAANALNNRLHNVEVHHAAAGRSAGLIDFPAPALNSDLNFGALGVDVPLEQEAFEQVRLCTLDAIAPADTRVIKIDVEGFEPEVLAGAERLIAAREASWVIEHKGDDKAHQVAARFLDAGYTLYWLFAPFLTPRAAKQPGNRPQISGDTNILAMPAGEPPVAMQRLATATDVRPSSLDGYPYLKAYGF